jgi:hypothetical protein
MNIKTNVICRIVKNVTEKCMCAQVWEIVCGVQVSTLVSISDSYLQYAYRAVLPYTFVRDFENDNPIRRRVEWQDDCEWLIAKDVEAGGSNLF